MQFKIEQLALAINPEREEEALRFLADCGISNWITDTVFAEGRVFGEQARNIADLRYNYTALDGAKELELLKYTYGSNWLDTLQMPCVSHIGMHVTHTELQDWMDLMSRHSIPIIQSVCTTQHSNPRIKDCRRYNYIICGTRSLIGVDMKFIVRTIINEEEEARQAALVKP